MDLQPTDDLFRGLFEDGVTLRADAAAGDGTTMYGHFAVFDTWTEIDSWYEGRFLERLALGSFKKTFKENRSQVRVAFDHGYDWQIGDKPLGPIDELREEDEGAYYEVPLLDASYNHDFVLPALQGRLMNGEQRGSEGLLGASFRFRVVKDEWEREPKASATNPDALPERTIREVRLYEFGPVVYPAYDEATAKVRCLTDHYLERRLAREGRAARAAARLNSLAPQPTPVTEEPTPAAPASRHSEGLDGSDPAAVLALARSLRRAH